MKPILELQNLSKKYKIRHNNVGYLSLRERMSFAAKGHKRSTEDFWALNDVSFTINPGDSVGIIGKNGAGKSTLLKILSKITPPTSGKITARGRVASLLEVGTGFHPELTGRENIFFNGSLLGMKRREIESKFDAIVDFSGVEKFLDTPLKHYSSGMQLRLAFAVAAFLEPEILVIDEVLAVGDSEFQKKCLGKMENVATSGRTILFVSHNLQALSTLCKKGVYLADGTVKAWTGINEAIDKYMNQNSETDPYSEIIKKYTSLKTDPDFQLIDIFFYQGSDRVFGNIASGKDLVIEVHYELLNSLNQFRVFLDVCDQFGSVIFRTFHDERRESSVGLGPGRYVSRVILPADFFGPLSYTFRFLFGVHNIRMMHPAEGISFRINVESTGTYNQAYGGSYTAGMITPVFKWEIDTV